MESDFYYGFGVWIPKYVYVWWIKGFNAYICVYSNMKDTKPQYFGEMIYKKENDSLYIPVISWPGKQESHRMQQLPHIFIALNYSGRPRW